jgi:hypothetical protein
MTSLKESVAACADALFGLEEVVLLSERIGSF